MEKNPKIFLAHILESIEGIEKHVKGISESDFKENLTVQDAVVRRIEIIGEAVKNLPSSFLEGNQEIPWKDIAGMRDKVIHEYFGVDFDIVWKVIKKDMPRLKEQIQKLL